MPATREEGGADEVRQALGTVLRCSDNCVLPLERKRTRAQSAKIHPDPFIEQAAKQMNKGVPRTLAEPAIVTEDGPLKGTSVFGVLGYLGTSGHGLDPWRRPGYRGLLPL